MSDIKINILYQDDDIIAVEKPSGIMVHPWREKMKRYEKTLMEYVKEQTGHYLYPVHRLDRPVSGVILFALSKQAARFLKDNWDSNQFKKEYLTLCRGRIQEEGVFDFPLKHDKKTYKEARTDYRPLKYLSGQDVTFLKVRIHTGRKHQIRRHFARLHYNLIGDTMYGKGSINLIFRQMYHLDRIFLHSYQTTFPHPTKQELITVKCPLTSDLEKTLQSIGIKSYQDLIE